MRNLVFLSHAGDVRNRKNPDNPLIEKLEELSQEHKVPLYVAEREPEYEKNISEKIRQKLDESFCLLVLYTEKASKSAFVNQEIGYADKSRIPVIYILENGVKITGFRYGQEPIPLDRESPDEALRNAIIYIKEHEREFKAQCPRSPEWAPYTVSSILDFQKRVYQTPEFYRLIGPMAVDFEAGYVVMREEVGKILDLLKTERRVGLTGDPASGKSVLLHSIGYQLIEEKAEVYFIRLKEPERPKFSAIQQLPEEAILLVDDAHLDREFAEKLLGTPPLKCKILLASRPLEPSWEMEKDTIHTSPLKAFLSEGKRVIQLQAVDAADSIVKLFEEKVLEKEIEEREKALIQQEGYDQNLLLLTWALETYKKKETMARKEVCETVARWLYPDGPDEGFYRDMVPADRERVNKEQAVLILLALAAFYRFEIPVAQYFLTDTLGLNRETLDILLESRILSGGGGRVSLHHSAVANLFLEAQTSSRLRQPVKQIRNAILTHAQDLQNTPWEDALFHLYLRNCPKNACELIAKLPSWTGEGKSLIRSLAGKKENLDKILEAIRGEMDVGNIGWCVWGIANASIEVARKIVENPKFDWQGLIKKLKEEKDVGKIRWCVEEIANASKKVALKLVPVVIEKLKEEKDVGKIGRCVEGIAEASIEVAWKIVEEPKFDWQGLIKKLNKDKDVGKIGWCVEGIALASEDVARKIVEDPNFDWQGLIKKLKEEKDVEKIRWCVEGIARASKDVARKIVENPKFDRQGLIKKLKEEKDVGNIGWCLERIARASKKVALKLVPVVIEKLKEEQDVGKIGRCVLGIANASEDVAREIFQGLEPEVQNILRETFPWRIKSILE
ncbi:MAG TPA: TIR and AAA domain-containing protein [Fimbriimonadales bacterium]|nr:TIR and AAA domain-containing protein [Fimbriimonadales bacterium]